MKKTIVKVLAIVFVVSILVSSMFLMTGAACTDKTIVVEFNDSRMGYCRLNMTYEYNQKDAEVKVKLVTFTIDELSGAPITYIKKHNLSSDLKYNSSKKGFYKTKITLKAMYPDNSSAYEYLIDNSAGMSVTIKTNANREPKAGDQIRIELFDMSDGMGFVKDTTIDKILY